MRIITIDNGNTNPHVGIFLEEKLDSVIPLRNFTKQNDDIILISDVGAPLTISPNIDLKSKRHTKDGQYYFFDMPVHYASTLGDDRLITSFALFSELIIKETILLIDAGTFITMDIVSEKGFLGGYIFPGLRVFLETYGKGSKLNVLERKKDFNLKDSLPHTTDEAILGAADCYIESVLESTIKKTSPSRIVITGGSSELIKNKIELLNLKVPLEINLHLIHSALFLTYQHHLRLAHP